MNDHDFLKKALEDGFTLKLENGKLKLTKDNLSIYKDTDISYHDFLRHFNETSKGLKPKSFINSDLYPGPVPSHPRGMFITPEDFDKEYRINNDNSDDGIDVPPMARFDPILPGDGKRKKNKKKRDGGPDPDHLRKPGNGDYFM